MNRREQLKVLKEYKIPQKQIRLVAIDNRKNKSQNEDDEKSGVFDSHA